MLWRSEDEPLGTVGEQGIRTQADTGTLSALTLLTGFLGGHKFYLGRDSAGAIYFVLFVLGLVTTLYLPIWVSIPIFRWSLSINLGNFILLLPFALSAIDFLILQMSSRAPLRETTEPLGLVFGSQAIYILLILLPAIIGIFG